MGITVILETHTYMIHKDGTLVMVIQMTQKSAGHLLSGKLLLSTTCCTLMTLNHKSCDNIGYVKPVKLLRNSFRHRMSFIVSSLLELLPTDCYGPIVLGYWVFLFWVFLLLPLKILLFLTRVVDM